MIPETRHASTSRFAGILVLLALAGPALADAPRIAGIEPWQRPAGAPTVAAAAPDPNALHGVSKPVPESIERFVKDQGHWYTPFTRPGMPPPYDLRGWHSQPSTTEKR